MATGDLYRARRPFAWGVLVISDRDAAAPLHAVAESPISASSGGIVVHVRHAADVDGADEGPAEVEVHLSEGEATGQVAVTSELEITSGVLVIGDGERMDEVAVEPGRWAVTVALDEPQAARVVRVGLRMLPTE